MASSPASFKEKLKDENYWLRLPFMLLFFLAWKLTEFVIIGVILVQTVFRLVAGKPQEQLLQLGSQLTLYAYQIFRYLTFNSDSKPFPFADWPVSEAQDTDPYQPQQPPNDEEGEQPEAKRHVE